MLEAQLEDELEQSHLDVTLTNTTLLSIFFGLVVVCGVFFGFGYSLGGHKALAQAPAKEFSSPRPMPETASLSTTTTPPKAIEAATSKPSASVVTSTSGGQPAEAATVLPAVIAPAKPSPAASAAAVSRSDAPTVAKTKTVSSAVAPAASVVAPTTATPGRTYMVQVAALAHPGDADILCNALRRKGYSVIMASSKQDKLLHVQVGPFASADEAKTMRDKLTTDGYSPILK